MNVDRSGLRFLVFNRAAGFVRLSIPTRSPRSNAPADADRWSDTLAVMTCEAATMQVEDPACPAIRGTVLGGIDRAAGTTRV